MPRALVLDDQESLRDLIASAIARLGYEVDVFADGRAAIAGFTDHADRFNVVVSDIVLGGDITGIDVAQAVLQRRPNVPLLLVSGSDMVIRDMPPSMAFLHKPFTVKRLVAKLTALSSTGAHLDRKHLIAQRRLAFPAAPAIAVKPIFGGVARLARLKLHERSVPFVHVI